MSWLSSPNQCLCIMSGRIVLTKAVSKPLYIQVAINWVVPLQNGLSRSSFWTMNFACVSCLQKTTWTL